MPRPVQVGIKRVRQIMTAVATNSPALRQCVRQDGTRKDGYRRQGEAQRIVERMLKEPGTIVRPGYELGAYQCEICALWHVGSAPKR